jgi:ankyrin repeat protein
MRRGPALVGWLAASFLLICSAAATAAFPAADGESGSGRVDSRSSDSQDRLVAAALEGDVEIVESLLRAGVPATARDSRMTAIEAAAGNGHVEVWRLLVQAGALRGADRELVDRLAEAATVLGSPEILRGLQPLHFDPNGPEPDPLIINVMSSAGGGSLSDRLELLRMLLAAGADVNRTNESGVGALLLVRDLEMARLLLDAGIDVNQRNSVNETAAMLLPADREDLALYYLDRGLDPSIRSEFGRTLADRARADNWQRVLARLGQR